MNCRAPVSDETLCAYVDGELSPAEAADLATRALVEPALATRVARYHALKAGVATLADVRPAPPLRPVVPLRRDRLHIVGRGALAAGLAGLLLLSGLHMPSSPASEGAPTDLLAHHDAWAAAARNTATDAPDWLTSVMAGAGLRLVHVSALSPDGGLHLAFVGRNSCRVSLFERPANGAPRALRVQLDGPVLSASWQTRAADFVLIARDMHHGRFDAIARVLGEASQRRDTPAPELIASLSAAWQPCTG